MFESQSADHPQRIPTVVEPINILDLLTPPGGGMHNIDPPPGSHRVPQLDRLTYTRTTAEQHAFNLLDHLLPSPGTTFRALSAAELTILGRTMVRPGIQLNPTEFTNYLHSCLNGAGATDVKVSLGTDIEYIRPSHPASAHYPAPIRTPFVHIRATGIDVKLPY